MKKQLEKPFEYLKRKNGTAFSPETVTNWYKARAFVLDALKDIVIGPESNEQLHVVITSSTPLMLAVVRQVALLAHFANYNENTGQNRTVISLVSSNRQILEELKKEEYLCNLPNHCKYTLFEADPVHDDSYLDIELHIVEAIPKGDEGLTVTISEEAIHSFVDSKHPEEVFSIDTRRAVMAGRIYELGTLIDNLPAEDINDTSRYQYALDVFKYKLKKSPTPLVDAVAWGENLMKVKNGLSNIFCTDCFGLRIKLCQEQNNEALSRSEHARWATEKLIMGFRPMNPQERYHDEQLFGEEKRQFRNLLKKNPADPVHIDLCSYNTLRRINPDDLKYDSFMMLSIPMILKATKE